MNKVKSTDRYSLYVNRLMNTYCIEDRVNGRATPVQYGEYHHLIMMSKKEFNKYCEGLQFVAKNYFL